MEEGKNKVEEKILGEELLFDEKKFMKKLNKTERDTSTLFRSVYRNQNSLIQVADNKANTIIGINTMIISSVIALTGYGVIFNKIESQSTIMIFPLIVIMLACLFSAVLAIMATRPRVIITNKTKADPKKVSILFFGEISKYTQAEYIAQMEELLTSKREIYRNMIIDIFHQGVVLQKKYQLLAYAYTIFMFGFIAGVLIFVFLILF